MNKSDSTPVDRLKKIIIDLQAIEAELRPMNSDRIREVFVESSGKAAECIARAAICVKLLEERGESLHGIPQIRTLRRVASGQVLPDLVWTFAESPGRDEIMRAPLPDQRKIVNDPIVPVVEPTAGGGVTTRMTDLTKAPREVVRQVLGPEGIRTPQEQVAYIAAVKSRVTTAPRKSEPEPIKEPLTRTVTVKLTESEYQGLVINAARLGLKPGELARRGLVKSNVIEEGKR